MGSSPSPEARAPTGPYNTLPGIMFYASPKAPNSAKLRGIVYRQLTISKKSVQTSVTAVSFDLCQRSKALLSKYFTEYPPRPSDYEKPSYSTYHTAAPTNSSVEIYSAVGKEGSFSRYDERLPIVEVKQELLAAIGRAEVVVVTGETGCGKSTQVPQYILGQDVANRVICTQPRRLSAVSLADRVAEESGECVY